MERKTAILVDGGFYRRRAQALFGNKTAEERVSEMISYCSRHLTAEHSCTTKGCAILQEAEKVLRAMHKDLKRLGDCATCRHDKAVGYDDAPCTCCMRGEKWEWGGEDQ